MSQRNVICLVVDRLHAGMLGAWGNTWIRTPHLDHLACESFVCDFAFIDTPQLGNMYQAFWYGRTAFERANDADNGQPGEVPLGLPGLLTAAGLQTVLITDDHWVFNRADAGQFSRRLYVESEYDVAAAQDLADTQLARLFSAVSLWLQTATGPFFVWIHARGMSGAWDAPYAMRQQYADDEDPAPPEFTTAPNRVLPAGYEPDELLGITHAYAGQISLLDECVGALTDQLRDSPWGASTQFTMLSARGFPLGEHLRVGPTDEALFNELVQIPWLMRFPDGLGTLTRCPALVQTSDLPSTLLEWLGVEHEMRAGHASSLLPLVRGERDSLRDRLFLRSGAERALRTLAWHLRFPAEGLPELYAKPSDRWEVNEVGKLLPEITTGMITALEAMEQPGEAGQRAPLDAMLITEMD